MTRPTPRYLHRSRLLLCGGAIFLAACSGSTATQDPATEDAATEDAATEDAATADATAETDEAVSEANTTADERCEAIAAAFVTQGSANADLADPEVAATCTGESVIVTSNGIPDFPYIETSPGLPRAFAYEFEIPVTPIVAETPGDVPLLGSLGVAINGVPIFGPTEGGGGDVYALGGGFTECGGHNGPTGYHYHTFDATGSDDCLFSEEEVSAESVLFGYAFDGYPIYSGNYQFTSSYELTDDTLFATDTWAAHTYVEGSGDLDECNGRIDEDGNYAYYTTDEFPYVLGCFVGEVAASEGGGGDAGGGGRGGPPPEDGQAPPEGAGE